MKEATMRRRNALSIAIAAVLGALAIAALPALAGAKDDHGHHRGEHRNGERHHHGERNRHQNAGTISAFDAASGKLTISLSSGGSISGLVTTSTEIKCEDPDDRFGDGSRRSRDSGNSGPGSSGSGSGDDNSGPGSSGSGDDNGRGEEEPGDDHGEGVEPGDDNGGRGGENHDERLCTTADLMVGAVVQHADRVFPSGVASFDEIELGHTS
jgi:hypothetical protein